MKRWILIALAAVALVAGCKNGGDSFFADVNSYWKDVRRAGTESSRQYIQSQISIMDALMTEYLSIGTKSLETEDQALINQYASQQVYLVARMRRVAGNIPQSAVSSELVDLVGRRGR